MAFATKKGALNWASNYLEKADKPGVYVDPLRGGDVEIIKRGKVWDFSLGYNWIDEVEALREAGRIAAKALVKLKAERQPHTCPEGREDNATATVLAILSDGRLHLSQDLHGCRWWNIDDVELAEVK